MSGRGRARGRVFLCGLVLTCVVLAGWSPALGAPATSAAGMVTGWTQVVKGGFADPNNSYLPSWAVFKDYLYISTMANEAGSVFSGSAKAGGDIWRTPNGVAWEQVGTAGLGDPQNNTFQLIVYHDQLYAISNNIGDHGLEVWVTSNGTEFTKIEDGGFGDKSNGFAYPYVFKDRLILGVSNLETGAEIWVSEDGLTFKQVVDGGMGHPGVTGFSGYSDPEHRAPVFKDRLYIGTSNPTDGGEIWRTADGLTWERVAEKGLTRDSTIVLAPDLVYDDRLYAVGTTGGTIDNILGFDLYRSADGVTWDQVVTDGFAAGSERNIHGDLMEFGGRLYLASSNMDPRLLNPNGPTERYELSGFQLRVSDDGTAWTQVGKDGFGTSTSFMAGLDVQGRYLYLVVVDYHTGNQLWRSEDGSDWEMVFQEPEANLFQEGGGPVVFQGHFVWFSNDLKNGIEIWRSDEAVLAQETTITGGGGVIGGSGAGSATGGMATTAVGGSASGRDDGQVGRQQADGEGIAAGWIVLFAVVGVVLVASIAATVYLAVRLTRTGGGAVAGGGTEGGEATEAAASDAAADGGFCEECGQPLHEGAKYCPVCGTKVRH